MIDQIKKSNVKIKNNKNNNLKKFNIYFKLLFLLPNITIKSLFKLVNIIKRLSFTCRKKLINKIYKNFQNYYKSYLINFVVKYKDKRLSPNKITYKILGTFLFLEVHRKNNKGIIYLKFNNSNKKQRFQYYDLVFFNQNLKDFSLYKSFFLKNSKVKWDLSKLTRRKHEETNKYKFAQKSIFIWPFTIIIKPFSIIVKNIFFTPTFIFKKWFKKNYNNNKKIYGKNKLYSQLYNIITIKVKEKGLPENIIERSGTFFWYIIQKYYLCVNSTFNISVNNYSLSFNMVDNNNIFIRSFKKYKQYFQKGVNENFKKIKNNKNKFIVFYNFYKKYLKISFIGLSFFLRLYCLYFFWFLYFINKIFYFINKILFNYWFRFFYFTHNTINIINNSFFLSFKILYKNIKKNYKNFNIIEFENSINSYLLNIVNVIYWNFNYLIKIKLKNNLYKDYFLILFYFYFKNFFFLNIFFNYNTLLNNSFKKYYKYNNNLFDYLYIDNYKYNQIYKLEYFTIMQKMYNKYPEYYKINNNKLIGLDSDSKKDYIDLIDRRGKTLLLR